MIKKFLRKATGSHPPPVNTGISGESVLNSVKDDFTVKSLRTFMENWAAMQATIYKPARLSAPKKGDWMLVWYNYNPGSQKLERVRKTFNLNRIPDLQQRRTLGNTLAAAINKALRGGWNVFNAFFIGADEKNRIKCLQ